MFLKLKSRVFLAVCYIFNVFLVRAASKILLRKFEKLLTNSHRDLVSHFYASMRTISITELPPPQNPGASVRAPLRPSFGLSHLQRSPRPQSFFFSLLTKMIKSCEFGRHTTFRRKAISTE